MIYSAVLPAMLALTQTASALVAAPINAASTVAVAPNEKDFVERYLFTRDDVMSPEDHAIAKRNGVDTNQMFRHTMYKRADGEAVTVWVQNSFNETGPVAEEDSPVLQARQRARPAHGWQGFIDLYDVQCTHNGAEFTGTTHGNAPFTGGANAIIQWTHDNRGHWAFPGGFLNTISDFNLLLGGSNGGGNMRFSVGIHPSDRAWQTAMGTADIRHLVRTARDRYQISYNGQWRMEAHGGIRCKENRVARPDPWLSWVTHRTTGIL